MVPGIESRQRLRDVPGFTTFWTASTVSGFGSHVTTLAIQVLVVVTPEGDATQVGLVNPWIAAVGFELVAATLARSRFRAAHLSAKHACPGSVAERVSRVIRLMDGEGQCARSA